MMNAGDYHIYITDLPRKKFLPADLAMLYWYRWEIEILFRESKTQYKLDEFDTNDPDIVGILLYAVSLSLLVSDPPATTNTTRDAHYRSAAKV